MKKKASSVVKQIISFLSSISSKAKIIGVKTKADAIKARLVLLSLIKSESRPSLMSSLSHKFHNLLDRKPHTEAEEVESRAIVLHSSSSMASNTNSYNYYDNDNDNDEEFPDLNHLFDLGDEDDGVQGDGSVIDMVKNSKENQGQYFVLENEIDNVADLFIKRFRNQIRLQKLESFKRFQQMLERSV